MVVLRRSSRRSLRKTWRVAAPIKVRSTGCVLAISRFSFRLPGHNVAAVDHQFPDEFSSRDLGTTVEPRHAPCLGAARHHT